MVLPEEIGISISRLSEDYCPHQCKWASPNLLRAYIEQKGRGRLNFLSCLSWDIHLFLPLDICAPSS